MPSAWMACSASATPAISHSTAGTGSGPRRVTASVSEGPGTYSVASHGGTPSASASISSAVYAPRTRRAALISRPNRRRKPGSSASSGRTTLIATGLLALGVRQIHPAHPTGAEPRGDPIARHQRRVVGLKWLEGIHRMAHQPLYPPW